MIEFASVKGNPMNTLTSVPFNATRVYLQDRQSIAVDEVLLPKPHREWPDFHRGVALGLSVKRDTFDLAASWITAHRDADTPAFHTGFIFAMGMQGHIRSLSAFQSFEYLQSKSGIAAIALVLGQACAYCGTMDRAGNRSGCKVKSVFTSPFTAFNSRADHQCPHAGILAAQLDRPANVFDSADCSTARLRYPSLGHVPPAHSRNHA